MNLNTASIQLAVTHALSTFGVTSFSSDGFTDAQISAIASAITAALIEYDNQKNITTRDPDIQ